MLKHSVGDNRHTLKYFLDRMITGDKNRSDMKNYLTEERKCAATVDE